jgi:calpain-15
MIANGKLWDMVKSFDEEGYMMAGGTPAEEVGHDVSPNYELKEAEEEKEGSGMVPGHAYSVIAAKEAKGHKLVNIRNPWGGYEWDGDFSDNSPLWT